MGESRLADIGLWIGIVVGLVAVGVLLFGLGTRALSPRTPQALPRDADRVQVEVLNATGIDGLAARTARRLRQRGFDVVATGNAALRDTSAVVVRSGTALDAQRVAQTLGLSETAIVTGGPPTDYSLDVTVTLGTTDAASIDSLD